MSPEIADAAGRVLLAMDECEAAFARTLAEIERQRVAAAEHSARFRRDAAQFRADAEAALATYNARSHT